MIFVYLILLAVFATSVLSGIFGMAGGLVLMGVLAAILKVDQAMTVHGFAQLIANGTRAVSLFSHIQRRAVAFYVLGFGAAAVLMWFVSFVPDRATVFITLGLIPFITFLPWTPKLEFRKPVHAILCGFVVTVAHMTAGVSGPILDMFFVRSNMDRFQMIGTKAITQCMGHLLKIVYFGALMGNLEETMSGFPVWFPLGVVVLSVTGTQVGGHILRSLSEARFRTYLRYIFLLIGTIYLIMGGREILLK